MEKKTWTPNEKQVAFINDLKEHGGKATLFQLNHLEGKNYASGAINTLITKGIVTADEEVTYECDVVFNGVKVGSVKKTAKVYELVSND